MRTMSSRFVQQQQRLPHENGHPEPYDSFPASGFAQTAFKGHGIQMPTTPIVKQRTFNNSVVSSPRVQMYRTRVVYNDTRPSSAGLMAHEAAV